MIEVKRLLALLVLGGMVIAIPAIAQERGEIEENIILAYRRSDLTLFVGLPVFFGYMTKDAAFHLPVSYVGGNLFLGFTAHSYFLPSEKDVRLAIQEVFKKYPKDLPPMVELLPQVKTELFKIKPPFFFYGGVTTFLLALLPNLDLGIAYPATENFILEGGVWWGLGTIITTNSALPIPYLGILFTF